MIIRLVELKSKSIEADGAGAWIAIHSSYAPVEPTWHKQSGGVADENTDFGNDTVNSTQLDNGRWINKNVIRMSNPSNAGIFAHQSTNGPYSGIQFAWGWEGSGYYGGNNHV
ncbi:MAG: hypothetical protein MJH11_06120, partial [Lentisphaeria bacterium]|nr:hypothetical protein [Lentisphaeria bacterium]